MKLYLDYINDNINNNIYQKSFFKNEITTYLNDLVSPTLLERNGKSLLFWYMHDLIDYPKCICGGNIIKMKPGKFEYKKCCSSKCSGHYTQSLFTVEEWGTIQRKGSIKNKNKTPEEKEKIKQKQAITLNGYLRSEECREKKRKTSQRIYGFDNPQQDPKVREKTSNTNLLKYGNKFGDLEKCRTTHIRLYGVVAPMQREEIKEKVKATNLERYNCEWNIASAMSIEKQRATNLIKYGNSTVLKSPIIRQQIKKTMIKRYGVENPSQNPIIHDKKIKTGYQAKEYVLPSGLIILLQGYEDKMMDKLLKQYDETEIIIDKKDMPAIWYEFKGRKHRYFPDFYIPKENLIIEVKSEYTMLVDFEKNLLKAVSVKNNGYSFKLEVF